MPPNGSQTFSDVLVTTRRDGGWVCEIDRTPVWISEHQIEPGMHVPAPGTRGPLTIAAFAIDNVTRQLRRVFS